MDAVDKDGDKGNGLEGGSKVFRKNGKTIGVVATFQQRTKRQEHMTKRQAALKKKSRIAWGNFGAYIGRKEAREGERQEGDEGREAMSRQARRILSSVTAK